MKKMMLGALSLTVLSLAATALQASTFKEEVAATAPRDFDAQALNYLVKARSAARAGGFRGLISAVCFNPTPREPREVKNIPHKTVTDPSKIPDKVTWDGEPAQVFDNLYFVGGKQHSAWILKDKEGLILIDTIFQYNSQELILDGMKQLDLEPKDIKYIIIAHGHTDHIGGVEVVQNAAPSSRVVMGEEDWKLTELYPKKYQQMMPNHKTGIRVSKRFELTLGETTVDVIPTPGHTQGTLGLIFKVFDFGKPIMVAYNGGTSPSFPTKEPSYGIPNFEQFIDSNERLANAAKAVGATVLLTNHSVFDNAQTKARAIKMRGYGPHPFVSDEQTVANYFSVIENCSKMFKTQLEKQQLENTNK